MPPPGCRKCSAVSKPLLADVLLVQGRAMVGSGLTVLNDLYSFLQTQPVPELRVRRAAIRLYPTVGGKPLPSG